MHFASSSVTVAVTFINVTDACEMQVETGLIIEQ